MKKIINFFKSLFNSDNISPAPRLSVEEIIEQALKSPHEDVKNTFLTRKEQIKQIDQAEEKLKSDIAYYQEKLKEGSDFLNAKIANLDNNIQKYKELKQIHDDKEAERNKTDLKRTIESYNMSKLKALINKYGFDISLNTIAFYALIIIAIPTVIAYISKLESKYVGLVGLIGFFATPAVIYAYFKQKFNERRFEMVIDYLTNIIPIFMQKAKISYALNEIKELTKYQMRDAVEEALDYINENTDDTNAEKTALEIIEAEFPNSRIKAVHNLMQTVEFSNSTNFADVCQNMYIDVDAWIRRVNEFQQDLRDRRNKLLLLCLVTLAMNCIFVFLYTGSEYFAGFTNSPIYQMSTMFFILSIILVAAFTLMKLNGTWLIDDTTSTNENDIKRAYHIWEAGKQKIKKPEIVVSLLALSVGIFFFSRASYLIAIVSLFVAIMVFTTQNRKYNTAFKKLNTHFSIEFPNWLRQVTLNLYTQTVINAIEESQYTCSYPMYRQLELFNEEIDKNPTSIKPFSELLHEFNLKEAQSSLKVLYSVQTYGQNEIKDQISSLVNRNQSMLDKAESLKNQSNLSGVETLGYVPMIIFSISMIVNMVLLFGFMMEMLGNAMTM